MITVLTPACVFKPIKTVGVFGVFLLLIGCTPSTTEKILSKAKEAHGGSSYQKLKQIDYEKTSWRLSEQGDTLSTQVENHSIDFEKGTSGIFWIKDSVHWQALKKRQRTTLLKDGVAVIDTILLAKISRKLDAAQFVFWQPFRLLESNPQLSYQGTQTLLNGWEVHHLALRYPGQTDRWSFFFDAKTYLLKATGVFFKNRYSLIINDKQESKTGLWLHEKRTSYFTDSLFVPNRKGSLYAYKIEAIH